MKDLIIKCYSKQEKLESAKLLLSMGFKYFDDDYALENIISSYGPYPHHLIEDRRFRGCSNSYIDAGCVILRYKNELNLIIKHLLNIKESITIKDVGDYEAVVSTENVVVGCQTISHEKVLEIADAIKKIKNS